MRLVGTLVGVSALLVVVSSAQAREPGLPGQGQAKDRYTVHCRWIKENDAIVAFPALSLADGERGTLSETSQSPFVTAVTPVTGPNTKEAAQLPHIVVLDEGMKIDVMVMGRQPGGVSVDVTVEESQITAVDVKLVSPQTSVQAPSVDTRKKRVFDFAKFGEPLAVFLGKNPAKGAAPRIELVVAVRENVRPSWTSHAVDRLATPGDVQRNAVFSTILATGTAKVLCQRVSGWERLRGHELAADLQHFQDYCDYVRVCSFVPHRLGVFDGLATLSPWIRDPASVRAFEEALFGFVPGYSAVLDDSPALMKNVELLGRLPWLWNVTIRTRKADDRLLRAVQELRVLHHLEISEGPRDKNRVASPQGASRERRNENAPTTTGKPTPPLRSVADAKASEKVIMGGVTPRIIIQGEEEERLGIVPQP